MVIYELDKDKQGSLYVCSENIFNSSKVDKELNFEGLFTYSVFVQKRLTPNGIRYFVCICKKNLESDVLKLNEKPIDSIKYYKINTIEELKLLLNLELL